VRSSRVRPANRYAVAVARTARYRVWWSIARGGVAQNFLVDDAFAITSFGVVPESAAEAAVNSQALLVPREAPCRSAR
jgi:hypothetical protein